jgi:hypothetical protein
VIGTAAALGEASVGDLEGPFASTDGYAAMWLICGGTVLLPGLLPDLLSPWFATSRLYRAAACGTPPRSSAASGGADAPFRRLAPG